MEHFLLYWSTLSALTDHNANAHAQLEPPHNVLISVKINVPINAKRASRKGTYL